MSREECSERIRLVGEYSQAVTTYNVRLIAARQSPHLQTDADWRGIEDAHAESQRAWEAFEHHVIQHRCLGWYAAGQDAGGRSSSSHVLGEAAAAALDPILVVDDERRFIDVNDAAAQVMGMSRNEIVGRRIDDFFSEARGETVPAAWRHFISEGVQCGICVLLDFGRKRRFEYRARSNFAPGLHLSILREVLEIRS